MLRRDMARRPFTAYYQPAWPKGENSGHHGGHRAKTRKEENVNRRRTTYSASHSESRQIKRVDSGRLDGTKHAETKTDSAN
jgi:hypothetical protein